MPDVEKFQISPHLSYGKIWNYSTCGEISDFSTFTTHRNLKFLHMTDFSPHVWLVILVTNIRYVDVVPLCRKHIPRVSSSTNQKKGDAATKIERLLAIMGALPKGTMYEVMLETLLWNGDIWSLHNILRFEDEAKMLIEDFPGCFLVFLCFLHEVNLSQCIRLGPVVWNYQNWLFISRSKVCLSEYSQNHFDQFFLTWSSLKILFLSLVIFLDRQQVMELWLVPSQGIVWREISNHGMVKYQISNVQISNYRMVKHQISKVQIFNHGMVKYHASNFQISSSPGGVPDPVPAVSNPSQGYWCPTGNGTSIG